uniref:ADP-ribosylation factor GTPase-activating protein 2/3 n=1 Tax=Mesocestoides corti TaxID=53468 RepID=A0A5K3EJT8_MESCO
MTLSGLSTTKDLTVKANDTQQNLDVGINNSDVPGHSVGKKPVAKNISSGFGRTKQPKKRAGGGGGFGGATKVKTDFAAIEAAAAEAERLQQQKAALNQKGTAESIEAETQRIASLRLAYHDIQEAGKEKTDSTASMSPQRAQQFERLGIGAVAAGRTRAIGHSAISDLAIRQEDATDRDGDNRKPTRGGFANSEEPISDFGIWALSSSTKARGGLESWDQDPFRSRGSRNQSSGSGLLDLLSDPTYRSGRVTSTVPETKSTGKSPAAPPTTAEVPLSDEMLAKLKNAKSISSADFDFGNQNTEFDKARFEGRNALSSDEYFGRPQPRYHSDYQEELNTLKEGIREGVTKVATRLSAIASDFMTQLQERYG